MYTVLCWYSILLTLLYNYSGCNILLTLYRDREDGMNLIASGGMYMYNFMYVQYIRVYVTVYM